MPDTERRLALDAPAKINLYLHVTGRRDDGYHLLDSLVGFTAYGDRLIAAPDDALTLRIGGPFGGELDAADDNLVLRAARALQKSCGIAAGAALTLEKNLPVASGIGGGSADAAAALRLLSALWDVNPGRRRLTETGLTIGADVPVCLAGVPARMSGIGERIVPTDPFPSCGVVLVNAGEAVSTPAVFAARESDFSDATNWETPESFVDFAKALGRCRNDLADAARSVSPVVGTVLDALMRSHGCALARLSGSGGTCFGLFENPSDAEAAAAAISAEHSGWWAVASAFRRDRPEIGRA